MAKNSGFRDFITFADSKKCGKKACLGHRIVFTFRHFLLHNFSVSVKRIKRIIILGEVFVFVV